MHLSGVSPKISKLAALHRNPEPQACMPTILKFFKNGELLPDAEISGIRGEVYPGVCGGGAGGVGVGVGGVVRCTCVYFVF